MLVSVDNFTTCYINSKDCRRESQLSKKQNVCKMYKICGNVDLDKVNAHAVQMTESKYILPVPITNNAESSVFHQVCRKMTRIPIRWKTWQEEETICNHEATN